MGRSAEPGCEEPAEWSGDDTRPFGPRALDRRLLQQLTTTRQPAISPVTATTASSSWTQQFSDKDHLAASWFAGEGTQTAPTSSALAPYFENAPIHVENFSLVYNRVSEHFITNQLSAGVSYFNQVFSDAETDFNPIGLGLNTGAHRSGPGRIAAPHHRTHRGERGTDRRRQRI
jgi:hypothetical protein